MRIQANIWKLKIFHAISEFLLVIPVITIFWLSNGLSMTQVFLLQSIYAVIVLFLEIPSGYFADKFGRRNSLIIGAVFYFLGFTIYGFSSDFLYFAIAESVLGIGMSFISGADSAILYDTLIQLKREKEYQKTEGSIFSLMGYSSALAAIIGGFVASIAMRDTFYIQSVILFALIPLAISLKEPTVHKLQTGEKSKNMMKIVKYALHENKEVKWLIIYAGMLLAFTLTAVFFGQPFWQSIGIPISAFGVVWAVLTAARGFFSNFASRYEKLLGRRNALISLLFYPVIGYLLMGLFVNQIWAVVFFLFPQFTFAIATPVLKDYINRIVPSEIRATVLSMHSLMFRVITALIGPFLGYSMDILSFRYTFIITAGIFLVFGLVCLLFLRKYKALV